MISFYYLLFAILYFAIIEIKCDNTTTKFNQMDEKMFRSRQDRLLSFNTQANGDISMEIAFNVPFITIPVKKSLDMAHGAVANLNIGAVALAGAIAFGFAVVIPGISLLMSKTPQFHNSGYRSEGGASDGWWKYLMVLDQALTENDIDTTSCMQRMICLSVKVSSHNVQKGKSSSSDKIIDGLATSEWMQKIIGGTAIHAAVENGLGHVNCAKEYSQCKISQKSMQMWAKQIFNLVKT